MAISARDVTSTIPFVDPVRRSPFVDPVRRSRSSIPFVDPLRRCRFVDPPSTMPALDVASTIPLAG
jgi:hypothetical protein